MTKTGVNLSKIFRVGNPPKVSSFLHHPTSVKLQTNPRIHGWDIVSRTNTIDTIELLYSYLAGMNGIAYTNAQCIV
jgi:hypothetical protein